MRYRSLANFSLLACSFSAAAADGAAVQGHGSRIRVFGQNGVMAQLYAGSACIKRRGGERVSGSLGSAFGSLIGTVSNVSLGMPDSENTRNLAQMDGIASKAYFREYAIPAAVPTSLRLGYQSVPAFYSVGGVRYSGPTTSCGGAISFVPEAGRDYEAGFSWQGQTCRLSVYQIVDEGGDTRLVPVRVQPAPKC
ncbi:hypothetical protein SAMN06296058_1569 [Pseudoxanthomonas indica]|uniref:Secreted protein n=2 Tax=Pseudoxanthomonas indica TaxID=428993 RepID=A0A1T5KCY0_9GAMM|nr:hypothetical protein SAMN06296058_1569 [Pseudoxanthomonas indica]